MGFWGDAWNVAKVGLAPVTGGASLALPGGSKPKKKPAGGNPPAPAPTGPPAFGNTNYTDPSTGQKWSPTAAPAPTPPNPVGSPGQAAFGKPPTPPKPSASGHVKTTAPYGVDQSLPGVAEQNWEQNQDMWYQSKPLDWAQSQLPEFQKEGFGEQYNKENMSQFGAPGQGQQYWNQVQGSFNEKGNYDEPNLAAESYQRTVQNLPGSIQPTFDAAFDRARDKSVGAANSQAAGRGAYGSSAALNGVNSVISDIEAERANRAGDFALQDSANQRNWLDSAANQGRSADLSSIGGFDANLRGMNSFGDMAFRAEDADLNRDQFTSGVASGVQNQQQQRLTNGIDTAMGIDSNRLSRINSGQNAAVTAQNARDGRIQGQFDNTRNFQNDSLDFMRQQYGDLFGGDEQAFQEWANGVLGVTQNSKNDDQAAEQQLGDNFQQFTDLASLGGGGGGGVPKMGRGR